jgi:hypothetical protein
MMGAVPAPITPQRGWRFAHDNDYSRFINFAVKITNFSFIMREAPTGAGGLWGRAAPPYHGENFLFCMIIDN